MIKIGRPLRWETREELINVIEEYFANTDAKEYTWTGLILYIGASRQLLQDYQKRPEFNDIVTEAKLVVENSYEIRLIKHGRAGDIFGLKNFGWKDRQEIIAPEGINLFMSGVEKKAKDVDGSDKKET